MATEPDSADLLATGAVFMALSAAGDVLSGVESVAIVLDDADLLTNKVRVTTTGVGPIIVTVEAEPS